jgi:hypothetical protein
MKVIYKEKEYSFLQSPHRVIFSYNSRANDEYKVTKTGKVSDEFQEYYDGVAALTTWIIEVPKESNSEDLKLDDVTEVIFKLKGTSVPRVKKAGNKRSGLVPNGEKGMKKLKAEIKIPKRAKEARKFTKFWGITNRVSSRPVQMFKHKWSNERGLGQAGQMVKSKRSSASVKGSAPESPGQEIKRK